MVESKADRWGVMWPGCPLPAAQLECPREGERCSKTIPLKKVVAADTDN